MHNIMVTACLSAALSLTSFGASAMSIVPAIDTGAGRYRGAGGYCAGHRVPTIKKVCAARRYRGALVRRCHTYRISKHGPRRKPVPSPSDGMIVHSREPFNAEPTLARLRSSPVTAPDDFDVRSHGNTPTVDPGAFALAVGGLVATPLSLSLDDLRDFPQTSIEATMQCAGNRRADMLAVRPVAGDPWSPARSATRPGSA